MGPGKERQDPTSRTLLERPNTPPTRLQLLSGFSLTTAGTPTELPLTAQRLVAYLALAGHPVHREHVAGTLWMDTQIERAGANLRSTLWRVRSASPHLIESTRETLRLSADVAIDVRELLNLAVGLSRDGHYEAELTTVQSAGDLLPAWYDDWVIIERERLRQIRLHTLELLCERLTATGELSHAVQAGMAAVAAEPLRESAHRGLIRAHLAQGNVGEAIRQYQYFRRLLREELAVEPTPLMQQLLAGLPIS